MVTVREGQLLPNEEGPAHRGRAPIIQPLYKPKKDGIITQKMPDPNLTNYGYESQEVSFSNARTSEIVWCNSKIRDYQQFPGAAKKTL